MKIQEQPSEQDSLGGKVNKEYHHFKSSFFSKRMAFVSMLSIIVGELLIVLLIKLLKSSSSLWENIYFDAFLLAILIFPAVYFWGIRPLTIQIAERKKAEEALRYSLSLMDAMLNSIHSGILAISSDQRTVIKTNANFAEMWCISGDILASVNNKTLMDSILGQLSDPDAFNATVLELYEKPKAESHDFIYLKDGRILERISKPIYLNEEPKGRVWSFLDITDRKWAEAEIKSKNEHLLKSLAEKNRFFSIIAHDLKSPFNGFLGLTQTMAERLPSLTIEELQEIALVMENSATNLYGLLNNLLQWASVEQGLIPFNPEIIELLPIAKESLATILEPAKNKEIEITINISEDTAVLTDKNMLQTILRNFVSNAVKFTPKKGKINVSAKTIDDNSVEIAIKDSGIGMSSEMVENLFRLDVQMNRKGTEGEPSTGLGLLLCKEFIEKQDGKIWVESQEGKGSTFYFTIPCPAEMEK